VHLGPKPDSLRKLDGQYRTRSKSLRTLGDAAEKKVLDPRVSTGPHHDEVRAHLLCDPRDGICRWGIFEMGFDPYTCQIAAERGIRL
jgi:hypothetical protein